MADNGDWPMRGARQLRLGQRTEVWVAHVDARSAELVYTTDNRRFAFVAYPIEQAGSEA
jgi:hypothetical protein